MAGATKRYPMGSPPVSRCSPRTNRTASCAVASAPWPPCAGVLSIRTFLLSVAHGNQAALGDGRRRTCPSGHPDSGRTGLGAGLHCGALDRRLHVVDHMLRILPSRHVGGRILFPPVLGRRVFKTPV